MPGVGTGAQGVTMIVTLVVIVLVGLMMMRRMRPQPLKLERLWIRPVVFLVIIGSTFSGAPIAFSATMIAMLLLAVAVGGAIGWQRGRMMKISVDPETHNITVAASPAGVVMILVLMGMRLFMRESLSQPGAVPGVTPLLVTDALLLLSAAMFTVQSVEMYIRGKALLDQARSGGGAL